MNNKGFTLIEVLVALIVLGILMAITVPNIAGIMSNQKTMKYTSDAIRFADSAKTQIFANSLKIKKPKENKCIILSLNYVDKTEELKVGPNNGTYDPYESFIIMSRNKISSTIAQYNYYVRLVEKTEDNEKIGIELVNSLELKTDEVELVDNITTEYGINENTTTADLEAIPTISALCTEGVTSFFK